MVGRKKGSKNKLKRHDSKTSTLPAGNHGDRYGMIYMHVGKDRIGKKYRVLLEEIL